jgi:hypothetical protein
VTAVFVESLNQNFRQFLTAAGVTVRPMPGDRGYSDQS